jgi:hypothetical protein
LLGCAAASLINPWGLEGAIYPLMIFKDYAYPINENMPIWPNLWFAAEGFHFAFVFALAMVGLGLSVFAPERGDRLLPFVLMTLAFGALGWQVYRGIAIFGYIALAALPFFYNRGIALSFIDSLRPLRAVLLLLGIATFYFAVRPEPWLHRDRPGLGLEEGSLDGVKFFRDHKLKGPIFNTYNIGNYLIYGLYPDDRARVFVDGRPEAYPGDFFRRAIVPLAATTDNEEQWNRLMAEYGFNVIVLHSAEALYVPGYQAFFRRRANDPQWAIVFLKNRMVILVRRTPENKDLIDRYEEKIR